MNGEVINFKDFADSLFKDSRINSVYQYKKGKDIVRIQKNIESELLPNHLENILKSFLECLERIKSLYHDSIINLEAQNEYYGENNPYEYSIKIMELIKNPLIFSKSTQSLLNVYYFLECHAMLLVWNANHTRSITLDETWFNLNIDIDKRRTKDEKGMLLFRGQNDFSFELIPSFYRTLKKDEQIDKSYIDKKYKDFGLIQRYGQLLALSSSCLDYDFYSFMQHSISYSPLIDFSKSFGVAAMFSFYNNNPDQYFNNDRAIYELNILDTEVLSDHTTIFDIDYHKDNLNIYSRILNKPIYLCSLGDFQTEISVIKNATNDRMKAQKGVFMVLKKGIIVKKQILLMNSKIVLTKYKVKTTDVNKFYKMLVSNQPQHDYKYLMEPYSYFEDFRI